jgi:hypothetical protein
LARKYVFADESGDFNFSRHPSASRYFILVTVTVPDCSAGQALLDLRRELAWEGHGLDTEFHATEDKQAVRDRVFALLTGQAFRLDVTLLEKSKARPSIRVTEQRFYQMAWYLHMKYVAPRAIAQGDQVMVVGASLGTKKQRAGFRAAVQDVSHQVVPAATLRVASWAAASEPCLQVADYCAWAVQRKWEGGDDRSYRLIAGKIASEFAPFAVGTEQYY